MIPEQGNDMTEPNSDTRELNQDACELSFEELEQVSGGFDVLVHWRLPPRNWPT
jgi:bacteriocin-like protein